MILKNRLDQVPGTWYTRYCAVVVVLGSSWWYHVPGTNRPATTGYSSLLAYKNGGNVI